jgi:hypothetical protein
MEIKKALKSRIKPKNVFEAFPERFVIGWERGGTVQPAMFLGAGKGSTRDKLLIK